MQITIQIDLAAKTRKEMRRETATQVPIFLLEKKVRYGWETEAVFYSEEEAREAGDLRWDKRKKENVDWRVYCVPAYGILRTMLNQIEAAEKAAADGQLHYDSAAHQLEQLTNRQES